MYHACARHLLRVATQQVRTVASWAGNVMLAAHFKAFPSDVVLVGAARPSHLLLFRRGLQEGARFFALCHRVFIPEEREVGGGVIMNRTL